MSVDSRLGRYDILGRLASGGMGEVLLARQEGPKGFAKTLVLKRILRHLVDDLGSVEQFLNEARLAALLSHPNVVQVFELGEVNGDYYLAMEYVHGKSLRAVLNTLGTSRQLDPVRTARICAEALRGLEHAHGFKQRGKSLNIVHRDVSPENILISLDGAVKVTDFGIAKSTSAGSVTRIGVVKGKLAYMAPDHLKGIPIDARVDVYGVGVVLYELLTGRRPLASNSGAAPTPHQILHVLPEDPALVSPGVPKALADISLRALAKDPADRFPTAAAMAQALEGFVYAQGKPVGPEQIATMMAELFPEEDPKSEVKTNGNILQTISLASTDSAQSVGWDPNRNADIASSTTTLNLRPHGLRSPAEGPENRVRQSSTDSAITQAARGSESARVRRLGLLAAVTALVGGGAAIAWPQLHSAPNNFTPVAFQPLLDAPQKPKETMGSEASPKVVEVPEIRLSMETPKSLTRTANLRGKVQLMVKPWAEVSWKNRKFGMTPFAPLDLPAGPQVLSLQNSELGVKRDMKVVVVPGKTTVVRANLLAVGAVE